MIATGRPTIKVEATVNAPVEKVWNLWTNVEDVKQWNHASEDWHTTSAQNDLRPGGSFAYRMEAKDGSFGFDFGGTYDEIRPYEYIEYTLGDGRKVKNDFNRNGDTTHIVVVFESEHTHTEELQRSGWQAILDSFKKYAEEKTDDSNL
ncbi:SRPBCC family protein [Chitinophagaceae bacterium LB-8]|uniref:SRPBCC family protein n=1 Tax=Paraflavisolibacter caeni TaxID=2982496 RepID=A0A9X2XPW8_9BACT|nr:SRPBCC family protein [Paraflavisolibacter caeni]MCU7552014.1 SRPBCC family protein [Paraflavisolibacter caeni]